jgi:hypothetical protein
VRCDECNREAPPAFESGWIAFLVDMPDDPPTEVIVFCPGCVEQEFEAVLDYNDDGSE